MSISDRIDILHPLQAILVLNAPMSTTPVRVSRTASERPRGETEELSLSRRLLEPSTSLLTGVSNIACSEGSLLETRVEELSELQLERVCSVEEAKFPELQFSRGYALDNNKQILIVTQRHLAYHPPFGYVSRARITFQEDGSYTVHILMRVLQNGVAQYESEVHELLKRFSATSTYKFCPGIEWSYYHEQYFEAIRFDIKSVRRMEAPFYHIDSVNCQMWFELPLNASVAAKNSAEAICSACKRLSSDLQWQLKRTATESPSRKLKRQAASSRARLMYMSPASQLKRKQNASMERGIDKRKVARYENTEILTLADEQHTQMCGVMDAIDDAAIDDLQKIFEEGESHGVGSKLKEIWVTDKRQNVQQFWQDQARNGKQYSQELMIIIYSCI